MRMLVCWFGLIIMVVAVKDSGETCKSRPSEMKQGARLVLLHEKSPRRLAQLLSEQATRLSERDLA